MAIMSIFISINGMQLNSSLMEPQYSYLGSLIKNISIEPSPCQVDEKVIFIHSAVRNSELRNVLRTFIPKSYKKVFVVGQSPDGHYENENIRDEARTFGDLLVGNFIDRYRNLSIKHLTWYQYVRRRCSRASVILKMDDDTFVNFKLLEKYLKEQNRTQNSTEKDAFLLCNVWHGMQVMRSGKWGVPTTTFKNPTYPEYCSGCAYLTTTDTVDIILDTVRKLDSKSVPFWIDDVFVTGMLVADSSTRITFEPMNQYFYFQREKVLKYLESTAPFEYIFSTASSDATLLRKLYQHTDQVVSTGAGHERMRRTKKRGKVRMTDKI